MAQQRRIKGEPIHGIVQFRIRPIKDEDLAKELGDLPDCTDVSDVVRTALRAYFFGLKQAAAASYLEVPVYKPAPDTQQPSQRAAIGSLDLDTEGLELEEKALKDEDLEANIDKYLDNI
jgi:hypothetical protein